MGDRDGRMIPVGVVAVYFNDGMTSDFARIHAMVLQKNICPYRKPHRLLTLTRMC